MEHVIAITLVLVTGATGLRVLSSRARRDHGEQ